MNREETPGCESWRLLISKSCDDELTAGEKDRLDRHLAACGDCRKSFEAFRAVRPVMSEDVTLAPKDREKLIGRILGRIHQPEPVPSFWEQMFPFRIAWPAPVFAVAALVFLVLWHNERTTVKLLERGLGALPAAPPPAVFPAGDASLLKKLFQNYGGRVEWLGLWSDEVRVGLPDEPVTQGVAVFGTDEYVQILLDLESVPPAPGKHETARLLLKKDAQASVAYPIAGKYRARLACRVRNLTGSAIEADVDLEMAALPHEEDPTTRGRLTSTLKLIRGEARNVGMLQIGGEIFSLKVTAGEKITMSAQSTNL